MRAHPLSILSPLISCDILRKRSVLLETRTRADVLNLKDQFKVRAETLMSDNSLRSDRKLVSQSPTPDNYTVA